eukprot:6208379-Pleurochrysis_carterae.AAC.1
MSLTPPNHIYGNLPQKQIIADFIPVKSTPVTLVHGSWATVLTVHGSSIFSLNTSGYIYYIKLPVQHIWADRLGSILPLRVIAKGRFSASRGQPLRWTFVPPVSKLTILPVLLPGHCQPVASARTPLALCLIWTLFLLRCCRAWAMVALINQERQSTDCQQMPQDNNQTEASLTGR